MTFVLLVFHSMLFTSCEKSDEDIRKLLVGTWEKDNCAFDRDEDYEWFWDFAPSITFREDGTFITAAGYGFCQDYCDTNEYGAWIHCTCAYEVLNGHIKIVADSTKNHDTIRFNRWIEVSCISSSMFELKGEKIGVSQSQKVVQNTCYYKKN